MLIVTYRHVFISQQVNDPRRSRVFAAADARRCSNLPTPMNDERNSSDSLEDRNAGAQTTPLRRVVVKNYALAWSRKNYDASM